MAKKYMIKYSGRSIEMTKPNSTMLVYKIPYKDIENKRIGFQIPNLFIVHILFGRNPKGKDMIYVGKSKNGINNRPTAHKDKFEEWTTCYVLTQFKERTFFNDGTIQYLEDQLNNRIKEIGLYNNITLSTTSGTANKDDEEDCDDYLAEAYNMLNVLGLDLISNSEEDEAENDISAGITDTEARSKIPNGTYTFARRVKRLSNRVLHGTMEVKDGLFILKAGSEISSDTGVGLVAMIEDKRNSSNIEDGILLEDVAMNSPSACGEFIIGSACNGWTNWKNSEGKPIDSYRKS